MTKAVTIAARLGLVGSGLVFALAASSQLYAGQTMPAGPESAAPAPAAGAPDEATLKKGRELFATWGCESCHSLEDAKATGHVGPAFDGNSNLTDAFIVDRVTHGQGSMPAFGGQMSDEEIATLAKYVTAVAKH